MTSFVLPLSFRSSKFAESPVRGRVFPTPQICRRTRACAQSSEFLLDSLRSGSQPKQLQALVGLLQLPATEARGLLYESQALSSPNRQVRLSALATLGKFSDPEDADILISALKEEQDHSTRAAAANGLGAVISAGSDLKKTVERVVDELLLAAKNDDHFIVRYVALVSLGSVGDARAKDELLRLATDMSTPALEASAAIDALGEVLGKDVPPNIVSVVISRAKDREDLIRAAVARTLAIWSHINSAREALSNMREDELRYGNSPFVLAVLDNVREDVGDAGTG